jgi:hypothetical protein
MIRRLAAILMLALTVLVAAILLQKPAYSARGNSSDHTGSGAPVLVELFTSEGCSTCPPADKLLAELDQRATFDGVPVIALGEHVDYWDRLGWKDRFSSAIFTERQEKFRSHFGIDEVYTPEMVVDGRVEFVGNDKSALKKALGREAKKAKPVTLSLKWNDSKKLDVTANDSGTHLADVILAITESALTTSVARGENSGRVLHHAAVVRQFIRLGSLSDSKFHTVALVDKDANWNEKNLKAVIFVQDDADGTILGAQQIAIPEGR